MGAVDDRPRSAVSLPQSSSADTRAHVEDGAHPPMATRIEHAGTSGASSLNTRNLGLRIGADLTAATAAGFLVAPVITIIDRGIIENASGRNTLGTSLKSSLKELLLQPGRFVFSKPFALIFSLYFGTYLAANSIDSASSTLRAQPAPTVTAGPPKFIATSTTNIALCLYKDSRFAQMYGAANTVPRPVPATTFVLFAMRDCLTIFASFNFPPVVAPHLSRHMGESLQKHVSSASAAQIVTPAALQLLSTPLHLLGLDMYNREHAGWKQRATKVARDWAMSSVARMGRIVPAFGIGGVVNTRFRRRLMEKLE